PNIPNRSLIKSRQSSTKGRKKLLLCPRGSMGCGKLFVMILAIHTIFQKTISNSLSFLARPMSLWIAAILRSVVGGFLLTHSTTNPPPLLVLIMPQWFMRGRTDPEMDTTLHSEHGSDN